MRMFILVKSLNNSTNLNKSIMKKLLYLFLLAAFVVNSCSKDKLVTVNGIIQGYVKDYYSTTYLSGAVIQYQVGGDTLSAVSDSSGFFSISGLVPGDYRLKVSHAGYLSEELYAWIEPLYDAPTVKGGGKVDYIESVDANLPELSASVSGTIKKTVGPNNIVQPAANVTITVQVYYDNYFPRQFTTTTNSNGEYSLNSLPASYVYVYVESINDADNYYPYSYSTSMYLSPNQNFVLNTTLNRYDAGIYLTSTSLDAGNGIYRNDVAVDEDIVLNFNMNVSKDQTLFYGGIALTGVTFDPDADFTFSGGRVTINPPTDLTADTDYILSFTIYSTIPGDYATGSISFHTAP
jgi:hypothetical protein